MAYYLYSYFSGFRNLQPSFQNVIKELDIQKNPKLFYFENSTQPERSENDRKLYYSNNNLSLRSENELKGTNQEQPKNIKSQIKRAFSFRKDSTEAYSRPKPLKKTLSCDVIMSEEELLRKGDVNRTINFYPGLQSMINSYSDSFGYDGRKDNLAQKFENNDNERTPNGHSNILGQSYLNHSNLTPAPYKNGAANRIPIKTKPPSDIALRKSPQNETKVIPPQQETMYKPYIALNNREINIKKPPLAQSSPKRESKIRDQLVNRAIQKSSHQEKRNQNGPVNGSLELKNGSGLDVDIPPRNISSQYNREVTGQFISPSYYVPITSLDAASPEYQNGADCRLNSRIPSLDLKSKGGHPTINGHSDAASTRVTSLDAASQDLNVNAGQNKNTEVKASMEINGSHILPKASPVRITADPFSCVSPSRVSLVLYIIFIS